TKPPGKHPAPVKNASFRVTARPIVVFTVNCEVSVSAANILRQANVMVDFMNKIGNMPDNKQTQRYRIDPEHPQ
ncbi:MAG: hypothetical protein P8M79_06990, partial [Alphaproteobacteria bacterium]|nr:hypothetical protein [Alphaproteobacteria bacterium]